MIAACAQPIGVQQALEQADYRGLSVSIKSGGCGFTGYAGNQGGLMLDLSGMNQMHYDPRTQRLHVQPGVTLGQIYPYLARFGRLLPVGSGFKVGIAGLTLGGGYGFYARQWGLTCDSLQRVQWVDAEGRLHDSTHDPELLWACKGGGQGHFGAVTALEFTTYPAPRQLWHSHYSYYAPSPQAISLQIQRWFTVMAMLPQTAYSSWAMTRDSLKIILLDTAALPTSKLRFIHHYLATGADKVIVEAAAGFLATTWQYRCAMQPLYFKSASAGYYRDFADLAPALPEIHAQLATCKDIMPIFQVSVLGGNIQRRDYQDAAAYPHRALDFLGQIQAYYLSQVQTETALHWVRCIQECLASTTYQGAHYSNYPDENFSDWASAYYGAAYPRLQALKRRLDPSNRFQHPQSVRL